MELYLLLDHILRFEGFTSRLVGGVEEIQTLLQVAPSAIVLVEAETLTPRRISDEERSTWSPYLEDPVVFANRT